MKKASIVDRRTRALLKWLQTQSVQKLASLFVSVLSSEQIRDVCQDENIEIPNN